MSSAGNKGWEDDLALAAGKLGNTMLNVRQHVEVWEVEVRQSHVGGWAAAGIADDDGVRVDTHVCSVVPLDEVIAHVAQIRDQSRTVLHHTIQEYPHEEGNER